MRRRACTPLSLSSALLALLLLVEDCAFGDLLGFLLCLDFLPSFLLAFPLSCQDPQAQNMNSSVAARRRAHYSTCPGAQYWARRKSSTATALNARSVGLLPPSCGFSS